MLLDSFPYTSDMWQRLAELLIQTPPDVRPEDVTLLRESGMAGEVASRLPADHPAQVALKPARLALVVRNQRMRQALLPLLSAWRDAGVASLLLKGFALAMCEYPTPGVRPFGDIDVMLHEPDLVVALKIAESLGWRDDGLSTQPGNWTHEMAHLFSPQREVRLDVHRTLTSRQTRRAQKALTEQLWAKSRSAVLDGVPIQLLDPRDLAIHLALTRAWGGERGLAKPADYPDLRVLIENHHLTPEDVAARAQTLGLSSTWQAYLTVCNPWQQVFRLGYTRGALRLRQAAQRDGQTRNWQRLRALPRSARRFLLTAPDVLAVGWLLRTVHTPQDLLKHWSLRASTSSPTLAQQHDLIRGVYWLTRFLYPRSEGDCVPKALATHRALLRRGYPAVFVSGVRRTAAGKLEGHAWVEGPDGPLDAYEQGQNRYLYQVLFEQPTPNK